MRVVVDENVCSGHARCWGIAPEIFHVDDEGYTTLRGRERELAGYEIELARKAAGACPEGAIRVIED